VTFNNTTPANFFDVQSNGRASSSPFVDIFQPRDPTPQDITTATAINNYAIQQKWLNTATNALWELKNYTTSQGVLYANWILIAQHNLVTESLRDQTGIDVFPDPTNEINVIGDGTYIITTGTPSTNTLTISVTGAITTLYTENVGTATPMAGNLNVLGANGITTTGSGDTITITGPTIPPSNIAFNYTNVTHAMSPYTVVTSPAASADYYISVDCSGGAVQLNFPNAPTFKQLWIVKDRTGHASVSNITLTTPGGSVTFDGLTTYTMNSNYQAINLLANATPTYEVY
jgi:hypothetical protein